jgi:ribose transport system substrate-binding protein
VNGQRVFWRLVLLIFMTALVACQPASEAAQEPAIPEPAATAVTLGLLLPETANPYFVAMREGAEEMAASAGANLILFVADGNAEQQVAAGREMLGRGVAALILVPVNAATVSPLVRDANDVGVPVITIERRTVDGDVLTHISSDNVAGGNIAGDYLARAIGGRGLVVELEGLRGTSPAHERSAGFAAALQIFPEVELVARAPAAFDREQAEAVFAQLLEENPEIDAVFAHNDLMALGALEAAQAAQRDDEIVFVGFDAISEALDAIETGSLRATVAQQPREMGRLAVELAVDYVRHGIEPEPETLVDLSLVTR